MTVRRESVALTNLESALTCAASSSALSDCDVRTLAPIEPVPIDLGAALPVALGNPHGALRLADIAKGRGSAVVITSDATRAVPNRELLPAVVAELNAAGVGDGAIQVIIGTGAHRGATPGELRKMFGAEWIRRLRVANHDARGDTVAVGTTAHGNEVLVDRRVAEAEVRIALGLVEAHEFAGFTGGPKAILPAVCGYDTIIRNHSIAMMSDPGVRPTMLQGNPIHEEMCEAARLARLDFVVNVVLDSRLRPLAVAAGDPVAAQAELVRFVRGYAEVYVSGDAPDIVVTGPGRPLDINLYQSIKSLVAIEPFVGHDTQVVLLSACRDGTGSSEMLEPFAGGATPAAVLAGLETAYTIEKDHAFFIARFLGKCPNVIASCPGVADGDLSRLGFDSAATVEEAVGRARRRLHCRRARPLVYLVPRPQRMLFTVTHGARTAVRDDALVARPRHAATDRGRSDQ
jgi:nickel-dependent lactate racemase